MSAWTLVDAWKDAAGSLGVRLTAPVTIELPVSKHVTADILFHHFGAPNGTLAFPIHDGESLELNDFPITELEAAGYFISLIATTPEGVVHSVEDLKDMLCDWGWCGDPNTAPEWVRPTSWG